MIRTFTVLVLVTCHCASSSATQVFNSETDWLAAVNAGTVEHFDFTAPNVGLADQVTGPVVDGQALGQQLDWQRANTGLSFDFRFTNESFQTPSSVAWVSRDGGSLTSSPQVDHSWTLAITSQTPFTALAFTVNGAGSFEDGFIIGDPNGNPIGAFGGGPPRETVFVGFIFDTAFASLAYQDHANIVGGKPISSFSIANPVSAVPEPGSLVLLLTGLSWPLGRRVYRLIVPTRPN